MIRYQKKTYSFRVQIYNKNQLFYNFRPVSRTFPNYTICFHQKKTWTQTTSKHKYVLGYRKMCVLEPIWGDIWKYRRAKLRKKLFSIRVTKRIKRAKRLYIYIFFSANDGNTYFFEFAPKHSNVNNRNEKKSLFLSETINKGLIVNAFEVTRGEGKGPPARGGEFQIFRCVFPSGKVSNKNLFDAKAKSGRPIFIFWIYGRN